MKNCAVAGRRHRQNEGLADGHVVFFSSMVIGASDRLWPSGD